MSTAVDVQCAVKYTDVVATPRRRSWLYRLVLAVLLIAAAGAAVFIVWGLPAVLTRHPDLASASDRHKAISRTRTGLIALVVAAGAAGGLAYTARTHRLSREGHFTDRYSKAVEQLGDDKLEERLGGIYALGRLMADSDRDQPTILEVLAAWVRDRTDSRKVPEQEQPDKVQIDIQAALRVIGRRRSLPASEERPINLRWTVLRQADLVAARLTRAELKGAHLDGANLTEADLDGADLTWAHLDRADLTWAHLDRAKLTWAHLDRAYLSGAHLDRAKLSGAHLENASLGGAHLENASLRGAHLENAFLTWAHLDRANLIEADLVGADLSGADLAGAILKEAHLSGADLSKARSLLQSQLDGSIVDKDTKLPEGLHPPGEPSPPVG